MASPDNEWRDTALANEQELAAMRRELREFIAWLNDPVRGPIIFRFEVVEHLQAILAP
jgi:hypothetical protein